jgi:hypothetical protein
VRITFAAEPGTLGKPSEDWSLATPDLAVVLDGATVRTETGCVHGVAWYARRLGFAIAANAASQMSLTQAVGEAIASVAELHQQCDLSHPGTPSAAVGVTRIRKSAVEYFVLGDVTLLAETSTLISVTDDRVSHTAQPYRGEAERLPIGSPEKAEALLQMKHGELAARNQPGGYWVSAADPTVVDQALVGQVEKINRLALLSDGATRAIVFGLMTQSELLDVMKTSGPEELVRRVRCAEANDPLGHRWPRNKRSDDCTALYMDLSSAVRVDALSETDSGV